MRDVANVCEAMQVAWTAATYQRWYRQHSRRPHPLPTLWTQHTPDLLGFSRHQRTDTATALVTTALCGESREPEVLDAPLAR